MYIALLCLLSLQPHPQVSSWSGVPQGFITWSRHLGCRSASHAMWRTCLFPFPRHVSFSLGTIKSIKKQIAADDPHCCCIVVRNRRIGVNCLHGSRGVWRLHDREQFARGMKKDFRPSVMKARCLSYAVVYSCYWA